MNKLVQHLTPIVVAVAIGPLIAGIAVSLFAIGINVSDPAAALGIADILAMSGVYIVFAYYFGVWIALLAGILVPIWMNWRELNAWAVMAMAAIATCAYMAIGAMGLLGLAEQTNARNNFVFTLVVAVIAAAGCWLLMRRFVSTASTLET